MFRPPFLARVAAGAAVYALEETRRLPSAAIHFPITAVSQLLQTTMHVQQFVTSLALKGDAVFERFGNNPVEQPEWATFDEDLDEYRDDFAPGGFADPHTSRFDRFTGDDTGGGNGNVATAPSYSAPEIAAEPGPAAEVDPAAAAIASVTDITERADGPGDAPGSADAAAAGAATEPAGAEPAANADGPELPEVAAKYDYPSMTLAQLRARLRMLSLDDLNTLLAYEESTQARAPFLTMLTNRIATVRAQ